MFLDQDEGLLGIEQPEKKRERHKRKRILS
jgi:hypothetical protein